MSEPNVAFEDFRAGIQYLVTAFLPCPQWPVPEDQLRGFRAHSDLDPPLLERAILDLWEAAHTDALFAIGEAQAEAEPDIAAPMSASISAVEPLYPNMLNGIIDDGITVVDLDQLETDVDALRHPASELARLSDATQNPEPQLQTFTTT